MIPIQVYEAFLVGSEFITIYIELYETNFVATRLLHTGNRQNLNRS